MSYRVICRHHSLRETAATHAEAQNIQRSHRFQQACCLARVEPAVDEAPHLKDLPDGSGCTEVWEALSEQREK